MSQEPPIGKRRRVESVGAESTGVGISILLPFLLVGAFLLVAATIALYAVMSGGSGANHGSTQSARAGVAASESTKLDKTFEETVGLLVPILRVTAEGEAVEISRTGSIGSGFLVSKTGHVLTNHHVIESYRESSAREGEYRDALKTVLGIADIKVEAVVLVFIAGKEYDAHLVRGIFDTEMDYALLQIRPSDPGVTFPYLRLHPNSRTDKPMATRLDRVMALGYPGASFIEFESDSLEAITEKAIRENATKMREKLPRIYFEYNLTSGVVSRITQEGPKGAEVIMHDAVISGGNSGGPLVDLEGNVIGVNTWAMSESGITLSGYGSAVSIKSILPHIARYLEE